MKIRYAAYNLKKKLENCWISVGLGIESFFICYLHLGITHLQLYTNVQIAIMLVLYLIIYKKKTFYYYNLTNFLS